MRKIGKGLLLVVIIGVTGCSALLLFHKYEEVQAERQRQDLNCELLISKAVRNACARPEISSAYIVAHDLTCKSKNKRL